MRQSFGWAVKELLFLLSKLTVKYCIWSQNSQFLVFSVRNGAGCISNNLSGQGKALNFIQKLRWHISGGSAPSCFVNPPPDLVRPRLTIFYFRRGKGTGVPKKFRVLALRLLNKSLREKSWPKVFIGAPMLLRPSISATRGVVRRHERKSWMTWIETRNVIVPYILKRSSSSVLLSRLYSA